MSPLTEMTYQQEIRHANDRQPTVYPFPISKRLFLVVDFDQLPDVTQDGVWRGTRRVQRYPPPPAKIRCYTYQSQGEGNSSDGPGTRDREGRVEQLR